MKQIFTPFLLFSTSVLMPSLALAAAPQLVTYDAGNQLPVVETINTLQGKEGQVLSRQFKAFDKDADALQFSLISGPDDLRISSSGLMQWHPSYDAAGEHAFTIAVSDGKDTVHSNGIIIVSNTNRAPSFTSMPLENALENHVYEYSISSSDEDGDELKLRLSQRPEGMRLAANTLTWQPTFQQAGKHDVAIILTDGEAEVEQRFSLMVENNNRAPQWQPLSIAPVKEGGRLFLPLLAKDADGDRLDFSIATGPKEMLIDEDAVLIWAPDYESAGKYTVDLLVSDGEYAISQVLAFEVENVNREPVFTSLAIMTAAEGLEYSYSVGVSDPDNDKIKLALKQAPTGMLLKQGQLLWSPNYQQAGQHQVIIEASDGQLSSQQVFNIAVENTNRAPRWTTESLPTGKENKPYKAVLKVTDADGDAISYELLDGPEGMNISPTGVIEWQPGFEDAGIHQIKLAANDSEDGTVTSFKLQIENINRAPKFTALPPLTALENTNWEYIVATQDDDGDQLVTTLLKGAPGMLLEEGRLRWLPSYEQAGSYAIILETADAEVTVRQTFTLQVENSNRKPTFIQPEPTQLELAETEEWRLPLTAQDADGDKIKLALSAAPRGVKLVANTLSWQPDYLQAGPAQILVSATDAESEAFLRLDVNVANTNRAPIIQSTAVTKAKEDQLYEYQLLAVDADIEEDFNNSDVLSYNIIQGPQGMGFSGNRLHWKPNFDQAGEHAIKLAVSDGSLLVEQDFTVIVENTNRAPVFNSQPGVNILEAMSFEYVIEVVDEDGDLLHLSVENAPAGMQLNDNILSWKPDYFSAGEYAITIKANDGSLSTKQTFNLTVENNNRLPVFASKPLRMAHENVDYQYAIKVLDEDKEAIALQLLSGPRGMTLTADGVLTWRPDFNQSGQHAVKVSASDGHEKVFQGYTINVQDTNREPMVTSIGTQSIVVDDKFRYQIQAEDVDGDTLAYYLVHAPEGMELDEKGQLYWRPDDKAVGAHTIIFSVSDGDLKVRKHFNLRVNKDGD